MKTIYINGDYITLENKNIEALMIEDKIIKKVGKTEEILKLKDSNTVLVDLKGKTMMPAFLDSHSHFFAVANSYLQVSLADCKNFEQIIEKIKSFIEKNKIAKGKWIIANNYDHNILKENTHITKKILDKAIKDNPLVIQHKSGHSGIFNTKAFDTLSITQDTVQPFGGVIEIIDGELTGLLEENAFLEQIKRIPMPSINEILLACKRAQQEYLSYGITTIQEGMLVKELVNIYKQIISSEILGVDLIGYVDWKNKDSIEKEFIEYLNNYKDNFKIGGYKIFLDGSPQLKTAWMETPYIGEASNFGYSTMKDQEVQDAIIDSCNNKMQILAHCNGDRACKQYIESIKKCTKKYKIDRPVMVHAQLLNINQLREVKTLGIIPSFFIAHTYYWGDVHIKNFGFDRAKKISPANSSLKNNILFAFHQDSPVIKPNMFETIYCAVERKTNNGLIIGDEEKVSVIDAIRAVTINVAYQYHEENIKGSIKEGKLANLIIINKNPLKINKEEIKEIKVLETIKEGKTLYKSEI